MSFLTKYFRSWRRDVRTCPYCGYRGSDWPDSGECPCCGEIR